MTVHKTNVERSMTRIEALRMPTFKAAGRGGIIQKAESTRDLQRESEANRTVRSKDSSSKIGWQESHGNGCGSFRV